MHYKYVSKKVSKKGIDGVEIESLARLIGASRLRSGYAA
jgi:hypothetical protein